jgi:hypothetical protein
MRSKVEYAMQQDDLGKNKVVKLGMAPIQREGMEYEFTVFFDIDSNCIATPTKDRTDLFSKPAVNGFVEKRSFKIDPSIGEELSAWLNTGAEQIQLKSEAQIKKAERLISACDSIDELQSISAEMQTICRDLDGADVTILRKKYAERQAQLVA